MMSITTFMSSLILSSIIFMSNPVKMMFTILAAAFINFYMMSECTGSSWLPVTLLLLFVGGILVMFTIVSALTPNEKSFPAKMMISMAMLLTVLSWSVQLKDSVTQLAFKMGMVMQGSNNILLALLIMTCYFSTFTQVVKKKTYPLRSTLCY